MKMLLSVVHSIRQLAYGKLKFQITHFAQHSVQRGSILERLEQPIVLPQALLPPLFHSELVQNPCC